VEDFESGHLVYGDCVDPSTGDKVDEVLVSLMRAPKTYTREDVVEINCHGGPLMMRRILELTLEAGARSGGAWGIYRAGFFKLAASI